MSAYIVFTRDRTFDEAELSTYNAMVAPTLGTFGMKSRVVYGQHKVLEGAEIEGMVIIEFPTIEDATAWYESTAYQEARAHRFKGAEYRCVLVQGV
ncbi:DUF1330 domain-containing protein [Caballeronia sp. 15715]|uniref:DUF1330 domain-containing protein n=1 Tax=Caballeronia sp. 15715 TaxID=3391030 RepID=UPI0039E32F47